jgi:alpha-mannosidase
MEKNTQIHLIGNAHIDILWLWKWEEGIEEIRATFASALDRIAEHGDFIFTSACAYYYSLVEKMDPPLFNKIREAVRAGRWCIAGGWWLQPDCNAPAGESFVRQGLYAQRYFKEKFGRTAAVGYNVDSFGHNAGLPQILRKSGLDSYVFMRPGTAEKELPAGLFTWEGIDGSQVLAARLLQPYNSEADWGEGLRQKIEEIKKTAGQEGTSQMCFYGVGNHGGGPTKENLRTIDGLTGQDREIRYSDPDRFFADARSFESRPVVRDELQFHAIGCYSSLSRVKKANNQSEQQLLFAEKLLAVLGGKDDRREYGPALTGGWKKVLVNQFHDSLGGCSIPEAYPRIFNAYGWCQETVSQISAFLLQRLAAQIRTFENASTLIIWNPHPWEVSQCVDVNGVCEAVHDVRGRALPFELVPTNAIVSSYSHATRFTAVLPPLGYTVYRLTGRRNGMETGALANALYTRTGSNLLRSGPMELEINRETGCISSLFDKEKGIEYLGEGGICPEIIDDNSDTWTHALSSYKGIRRKMELQSFSLVSEGKVTVEYELTYKRFKSTVIMRVILNGGLRSVDLKLRIIWNEGHRLLKLRIPTAFMADSFFSEIPYGFIERAAGGREWPIQRWAAFTGTAGAGLAVLNDGVYSCSAEPGVLCLTLLRSPIYAHHEPMHPRPDLRHRYVDQGEHEFHIRLLPCGKETAKSEFTRHALELNQAPVYVAESAHPREAPGELPQEQSFCRISGESTALITAVKRSEDDDGWIIRAFEAAGQETEADIDFFPVRLTKRFSFKAFEIKTIKIADTDGAISETNLLEW